MPKIREYFSKSDITVNDRAYSAWETAGRRIGPLYNAAASDIAAKGKLAADDLETMALLYQSPAATKASTGTGSSKAGTGTGSSGSSKLGSGSDSGSRTSRPSTYRDTYVDPDTVSDTFSLTSKVVSNKGGKEINLAAGEVSKNSAGFWTNQDTNNGKYLIGKPTGDTFLPEGDLDYSSGTGLSGQVYRAPIGPGNPTDAKMKGSYTYDLPKEESSSGGLGATIDRVWGGIKGALTDSPSASTSSYEAGPEPGTL